MRQPIIQFTSKEQFEECLKWWKNKLFLNDWIIHWNYQDYNLPPLNNMYMGNCEADYVNKGALITLADYDTLPKDCIMTLCDEKVLVHELLHLVYPSYTSDSYEAFYLEQSSHTKLEQLAKSLIMVKYNLPFDWFDRYFKKEVNTMSCGTKKSKPPKKSGKKSSKGGKCK